MNTSIARPVFGAITTAEVMPLGRLVHAYLTEAKYETLRMLRTIAFSLPMLVLPIIVYLVFGVLMTGEVITKTPAVANLVFAGYSVFAIMGPALFSVGVTLAIERDAGLMKFKRALPAPRGAYLLAKMLATLFFATLAMVVMTTLGVLFGRLTLSPAQIAVVAMVMIVGALPFCSIGLFIGAYVNGRAAPAVANLVFLPMTWLSGLFFPPPGALRQLAVIWPAYHLDQLAIATMGLKDFRAHDPLASFAVLAGITVIFGALAIRRLARKG